MNKKLLMKSHEVSRTKIGPFSLACTDPYTGQNSEVRFSHEVAYILETVKISQRAFDQIQFINVCMMIVCVI